MAGPEGGKGPGERRTHGFRSQAQRSRSSDRQPRPSPPAGRPTRQAGRQAGQAGISPLTLLKMAEYGGHFSMADRIWSKSSATASSACRQAAAAGGRGRGQGRGRQQLRAAKHAHTHAHAGGPAHSAKQPTQQAAAAAQPPARQPCQASAHLSVGEQQAKVGVQLAAVVPRQLGANRVEGDVQRPPVSLQHAADEADR